MSPLITLQCEFSPGGSLEGFSNRRVVFSQSAILPLGCQMGNITCAPDMQSRRDPSPCHRSLLTRSAREFCGRRVNSC